MPTSIAEFRDVRPWVQYALGGIAGGGIVAVVGCVRMNAAGEPLLNYLAIAIVFIALVALSVVYLKFGKPCVLRHLEDGLQVVKGSDEQWLPFADFVGFATKWTDIQINGIYSYTQIHFDFYSRDEGTPALRYSSSAGYGSPKFDELQKFQDEMAFVIARRMLATLEAKGSVKWIPTITLHPHAIEMSGKRRAEPVVIEYAQMTQWQVDQGLFKLAIEGEKRPRFTEKASQINFYPGLILFEQLAGAEYETRSESSETEQFAYN